MSVNIDPLRNTKGELVGAVNCFLDVTERKRMESRSSARDYSPASRSSAWRQPTSMLDWHLEIAPDGQFLRVDEAICAITGYSRDELLASPIISLHPPRGSRSDREGFRKQVGGELNFYSVKNFDP